MPITYDFGNLANYSCIEVVMRSVKWEDIWMNGDATLTNGEGVITFSSSDDSPLRLSGTLTLATGYGSSVDFSRTLTMYLREDYDKVDALGVVTKSYHAITVSYAYMDSLAASDVASEAFFNLLGYAYSALNPSLVRLSSATPGIPALTAVPTTYKSWLRGVAMYPPVKGVIGFLLDRAKRRLSNRS